MPRYTSALLARDNSTDANFRAWVGAFITALTSVGIEQTAHPGQIDPATVLKPAGNNAYAGFATFALSDPLQVTAPIFIRFDFGAGWQAVPNVRMTVSTALTAAGAAAGAILLPQTTFGGDQSSLVVDNVIRAWGDGASFVMHAFDPHGQGWLIGVERSRDIAGAATGHGAWMIWGQAWWDVWNRYATITGDSIGSQTSFRGPRTDQTTLRGSNVGIFPIIPVDVGALNPTMLVANMWATDVGANSDFLANAYGAARRWRRPAVGWPGTEDRDNNVIVYRWDE